jgi:uncharacterized SAM-binding protein YcdF (DUF218 family)
VGSGDPTARAESLSLTLPPRAPRSARAAAGAAIGAAAGFAIKDLDLPALVSYKGERELLVVLAALLGAVLWSTRLRPLVGVATAGLALLWLVVAFTPLCVWLAEGLPRHDPPEPADAVFVMASARRSDGSGALSRLLHGMELVADGKAQQLVLCELAPPERSYAEQARNLMARLGMQRQLEVVERVDNTRDEAVKLAELYRRKGFKHALVVTSPAHSRRASAALEHEGVDVISSPAQEHRFDLRSLDSYRDRLAAFGTIMHERVGIWVYARRGWLGVS